MIGEIKPKTPQPPELRFNSFALFLRFASSMNRTKISKIALIDYGAGNIQSVVYALERLGASALVTDDANEILSADKVIFPGVGEASTAMSYLRERKLDLLIKKLEHQEKGNKNLSLRTISTSRNTYLKVPLYIYYKYTID